MFKQSIVWECLFVPGKDTIQTSILGKVISEMSTSAIKHSSSIKIVTSENYSTEYTISSWIYIQNNHIKLNLTLCCSRCLEWTPFFRQNNRPSSHCQTDWDPQKLPTRWWAVHQQKDEKEGGLGWNSFPAHVWRIQFPKQRSRLGESQSKVAKYGENLSNACPKLTQQRTALGVDHHGILRRSTRAARRKIPHWIHAING